MDPGVLGACLDLPIEGREWAVRALQGSCRAPSALPAMPALACGLSAQAVVRYVHDDGDDDDCEEKEMETDDAEEKQSDDGEEKESDGGEGKDSDRPARRRQARASGSADGRERTTGQPTPLDPRQRAVRVGPSQTAPARSSYTHVDSWLRGERGSAWRVRRPGRSAPGNAQPWTGSPATA